MPPLPKDPATRQRRNVKVGRAQFNARPAVKPELPTLYSNILCADCDMPKWDHNQKGFEHAEVRPHDYNPAEREHHPETERFWDIIWDSAISKLWVDADVPFLIQLVTLVDRFWRGDIDVAAEIRQRAMPFGLTPLDRRRLEWEGLRVDEVKGKQAAARPPSKPVADPRALLRVAK